LREARGRVLERGVELCVELCVEVAKPLPEALARLGVELGDERRGLAAEAAYLDEQALEAALGGGGLARRRVGLLAAQAKVEPGVVDQALSSVGAGFAPGGVEGLDLGAPELLTGGVLGQRHAGVAVGPGQRHQGLDRRLGRDLALADQLLDGLGQLACQAQAARHPARAAVEATGELLGAPGEAVLELGQEPPLLQGRRRRRAGQVALQDQRLGLVELPDHGHDRVLAQATQRPHAVVAVDDDVASGFLGVADHDDRHLLTVLVERRQEPAGPLPATGAQGCVAQVQLVKFQLHQDTPPPTGGL
jgi:hypothetical protein